MALQNSRPDAGAATTVKLQIADDIRLAVLDSSATYEVLVAKTRQAFPEGTSGRQLVFKYADAMGDLITVHDTQSLMFARVGVRNLKLSVVGCDPCGEAAQLSSERVETVRADLLALRDHVCREVSRLLNLLDGSVNNTAGPFNLVTPPASPAIGDSPRPATTPPATGATSLHAGLASPVAAASPATGSQAAVVTMPWHATPETNDAVLKFHNKLCRQPDMKRAKEVHTRYIREIIEEGLRQMGKCKRLEFTGSSYEGVKVADQQVLEFDVMIMMKGKDIQAIPVKPGYSCLKPVPGKTEDPQFQGILDQQGNISPEKLANVFFGHIQKLVNGHEELREKAILRKHGPAVQMDVKEKREDTATWFSVDLVPAFDISCATAMERYVAKPQKDQADKQVPTSAWRRSFSDEEKKLLNRLDKEDQGCRKQCLRVLKVMRNSEATFRSLTSYHLKTVLFHECTDKGPGEQWQASKLAVRVLDLLGRLERVLVQNDLKHYFLPEINLLDNTSPDSRKNMYERIQKLRSKEQQFKNFIDINKQK